MEFTDKDKEYILGFWYAQKNNFGDILLVIRKKSDQWYVEYLLRLDDAPRRSKVLAIKETNEEILKIKTDRMISKLFRHPDFSDYIDVRGDGNSFLFKLAMTNWVRFKK
jgi:hypothetical protein